MNLRWKTAQFFEVRWWRFYLSGKNKQEYLRKKKLYWQRLLDSISDVAPINEQDKVIDMGCGPSGLYIVFRGNNITAVDPLIEQYEAKLEVFSRADYPNVKFICSSIEDYEPVENYDYVFCMNAINHVADIRHGYAQLAKIAGSTGKIVVTIDAHNYSFMKAIFRIGWGDILHPHQYDMSEYTGFLAQQGFKVCKTIRLEKGLIFNHYLQVAERV